MSHPITIRLPDELSNWLESEAAHSGLSQGGIVRIQLKKARTETKKKPFMRLVGTVKGVRYLSQRKGFSKS